MGQEVRNEVSGLAKQAIEAYPQLYQIGLHGPDILFYYKPLVGGEITKEGSRMHRRSGEEFFKHAAEVIREHMVKEDASDGDSAPIQGSINDRKIAGGSDACRYDMAYLSYAYGFICHFALDVSCHGYIGQKIVESGISHTEIESEFDREMLVADGFDPVRKRLTDHLVPSIENGRVIADFYFKAVRPEDAAKAVKGMIFYSNIFLSPSRFKRVLVNAALKVSGNYDGVHGMMINYEKNPKCNDSCRKLTELYGQARELAIRLIMEYGEYLDGKQELDEVYKYNFESVIPD
ncbi:MAG: zinc dependent phospholipase C family protein [Clostridiales bacterium]|nr:zinc dependent phospholipase C family protein [Clostridiales bacterium]